MITAGPDLEELKALVKQSHKFLCTEFLGYRDWDCIHDDLEVFLRRPAKHKLGLLPRNNLKTSIGTIAYSIRRILTDPNIRILIANQIWDKSREMLSEIKQHLTRSNLKHLFGDFQSDQWNLDSMTIRQRTKALKEPTISTTGVGAESTGGHYDLILLDDLVGLQNYFSQELRDRTFAFYRSMKNLMEPGRGQMVVFGTRWHLDDLYSQILEKESKYYDVMLRRLVGENNEISFPKKFNLRFDPALKDWSYTDEHCMDYVQYLKSTMPTYEFASQYQNSPIDPDSADFRESQIRYWSPETHHPSHLYMVVDPAASLSRDADYSAMVVMGQFENRIIRVVDAWRGKVVPQELIAKVFEKMTQFNMHRMGVESFAYQKTLKYYLQEEMRKRNRFFSIDEIGRKGQRTDQEVTKEARIRRLQPFFEQSLIELPPACEWLKEELLAFPRGRHDDGIDCMAYGLDYIVPSVLRTAKVMKEGTIGELLQRTWDRNTGSTYGRYLADLKEPASVPVVGGA